MQTVVHLGEARNSMYNVFTKQWEYTEHHTERTDNGVKNEQGSPTQGSSIKQADKKSFTRITSMVQKIGVMLYATDGDKLVHTVNCSVLQWLY